jgi:hypothetical protein
MKRRILTIVPEPGKTGWWVMTYSWTKRTTRQRKKADLVSLGRLIARGSQPSQLRIKGRNGRIQTEHTYPRSSDPRRFKG